MGEKYERIQGLEPYKDISRGALQDNTLAWKHPTDNIQRLTTWKDSEDAFRALAEFYRKQTQSYRILYCSGIWGVTRFPY